MKEDRRSPHGRPRRARLFNVVVGTWIAAGLFAAGCNKDGGDSVTGPTAPTTPNTVTPPPSNGPQTPTVPANYGGRCVDVLGTVTVSSPGVTFQVWDDATIDGDVVSLVVNGTTVLNQVSLDGPGNKHTVNAALTNNGYNYVMLYAHNEGSIPPNTAALSMSDGRTTQNLVMSANLSTNGAYNIVVGSAPAPPPRQACPVSSTTPTPPTPGATTTMRWTLTDACNDGRGMHARFFDKTNNLVWPGDSRVYVAASGGTIDVPLSVPSGAKVCYGARTDPSTNQYWGIGIDGTNGCTDCCHTATNTTIRLNLTCQ